MGRASTGDSVERFVEIPVARGILEGNLHVPTGAQSVVLFAHGSGSRRLSPRNRFVAHAIQETMQATLLIDLLTLAEAREDAVTGHLRFDIPLLAERLVAATEWLMNAPETASLLIGYFGSSTGAAAALMAAARQPDAVHAVVSRGGRPDLAEEVLPEVRAPTLLIVGGNDEQVIRWNEEALERLQTEKRLEIVPGAGHLFEEPGALEAVAILARTWFQRHLSPRGATAVEAHDLGREG